MKNRKKSKAFTLFEILVSLIILGLVMSTFPKIFQAMLMSQKQVVKEEVFFHEFSLLTLILTRYYDEGNTVGDNFYKDLNATGGDSELLNDSSSMYAGSICRIGKSYLNNNIYRSGTSQTTSSYLGTDGLTENQSDTSTLDDVDDFNNYTEDYDGYKIKVKVKYIDDSATYSDQDIKDFEYRFDSTKTNTNLKLITVYVEGLDINITLKYPTANIGASKFLSLEEISR